MKAVGVLNSAESFEAIDISLAAKNVRIIIKLNL